MSIRAEIENNIFSEWRDPKVARWVINKFPLLDISPRYTQCPIYNISLKNGLEICEQDIQVEDVGRRDKLVMSGGFEGTEGHLKVIREMHETRALTSDHLSKLVIIMLEPDSYIQKYKKREPLVNIKQRSMLWSTSGLVDAVFILPDKPEEISPKVFYDEIIQEIIKPATWCVNIENPHHFEILHRGEREKALSVVRLFVHHVEVHTSFINSTKNKCTDEVRSELKQYLRKLLESGKYDRNCLLDIDEEVEVYFEHIAHGLN